MRTLFVLPLVIAAVVSGPEVRAAVPKSHRVQESGGSASLADTREALALPMLERVSRIRDQGPMGYRNLVKIMFDEKQTMAMRWKAVTAAGRLGGKDARPEIMRALKHKVWYMRSAGLVAMRAVDRKETATWARKLLSDPALVVRTAAVETLAEIGDRESASLLWQKMDAPENFKGGQSLFIRQKMAEALARMEGPGGEAKFIRLLSDRDEALHGPAIQGLERLTKQSLGPGDGSVDQRRAEWLRWWQSRRG